MALDREATGGWVKKLQSIADRFAEVEKRVSDPEVASDQLPDRGPNTLFCHEKCGLHQANLTVGDIRKHFLLQWLPGCTPLRR